MSASGRPCAPRASRRTVAGMTAPSQPDDPSTEAETLGDLSTSPDPDFVVWHFNEAMSGSLKENEVSGDDLAQGMSLAEMEAEEQAVRERLAEKQAERDR